MALRGAAHQVHGFVPPALSVHEQSQAVQGLRVCRIGRDDFRETTLGLAQIASALVTHCLVEALRDPLAH